MAGTVEPPEHRACRTNTNPERRGVEAALQEWRLGDANPRNLYVGNTHVGVIFDPCLSPIVVAAMNAGSVRQDGTEQPREAAERPAGPIADTGDGRPV